MADEEKSIGELRREAITALLNRIIESTTGTGEAGKISDLAQAVAYLEGTTGRG